MATAGAFCVTASSHRGLRSQRSVRRFECSTAGLGLVAYRIQGPLAVPFVQRPAARACRAVRLRCSAVQENVAEDVSEEDFYKNRAAAETAYAAANNIVPELEAAKQKATELRKRADLADRVAKEAEAHAAKVLPEAQAAVSELRLLAADIRGREDEISVDDLDSLASQLLNEWAQANPEATQVKVFERVEIGISGIKGGMLVTRLAAVRMAGRNWAVISIACAEKLPEGQLQGAALHWGCATQEGWGWEPPPDGWTCVPEAKAQAGCAWQTPFMTYVPSFIDEPITLMAAHGLVIVAPLEGVLAGGGLSFVVKRPQRPQWLRSSNCRDFFLSCAEAYQYFQGEPIADPTQMMDAVKLMEDHQAASSSMSSGPSSPQPPSQETPDLDYAKDILSQIPHDEDGVPTSVAEFIEKMWGPKTVYVPAYGSTNGVHKNKRPESNGSGDGGVVHEQTQENILDARGPNLLLGTWIPYRGAVGPPRDDTSLIKSFRSAVHLVDVALLQSTPVIMDNNGRPYYNGYNMTSLLNNKSKQMRSRAEDIINSARHLVLDAEECWKDATAARQEAEKIIKTAVDSECEAKILQADAEQAIRAARTALARLKGKESEVSLQDLHAVAAQRLVEQLEQLQNEVSVKAGDPEAARHAVKILDVPPVSTAFEINKLDGYVMLHSVAVSVEDTFYEVISIVAAEMFPEGGLDGTLLHWGCVSGQGAKWKKPPTGWRTNPDRSFDAGGGAWETPFQRSPAPGYQDRNDICVHVATLQLPLAANGEVNGIDFVLKTPHGEWLACRNANGHGQNFHASFYDGAEAARRILEGTLAPLEVAEATGSLAAAPPEEKFEVRADQVEQLTTVSSDKLSEKVSGIKRKSWDAEELVTNQGDLGALRFNGVCDWMVDVISREEHKAERSLMHRFDIAYGLLENARQSNELPMALLAITVWLRYAAARFLCWNKNYNVKPREISAAQDRLTVKMTELYEQRPDLRDLCLLALSAIGSGGTGDAGQRIRDEILHIQKVNNAKGGMMEEWHQKLHNNTSPDDVIICEALIAYIKADLDKEVYWQTLAKHNITRERLASFDRPIVSEPDIKPHQCKGLLQSLQAYLLTLKAVHSGADLQAAAARVLGYNQTAMKGRGVEMPAVPGIADTELSRLLESALVYQELQSRNELNSVDDILRYLEVLNEARRELRVFLGRGSEQVGGSGRLRDLLYLDLALVSSTRTLVESHLEVLRQTAEKPTYLIPLLQSVGLFVESVCMLVGGNQELVMCLKELQAINSGRRDLFLMAQSVNDRLRRALGDMSDQWSQVLQPTAGAVGGRLNVPSHGIDMFSEEVIRGTAFAPLAQMLSIIDPALRRQSGASNWQIISPASGAATGRVLLVDHLASVQHERYEEPVVLLVDHVGGEEEVPEGAVAVLTPDNIDVLCHSAVRARNCRVFLATCYDKQEYNSSKKFDGQMVEVVSSSLDGSVTVTQVEAPTKQKQKQQQQQHQTRGAEQAETSGQDSPPSISRPPSPPPTLQRRPWCGKYVVTPYEFRPEIVGSKSLNTLSVMGRLPFWIRQPSSLAIPFGTFEGVLDHSLNDGKAREIHSLISGRAQLRDDAALLEKIRGIVMSLHSPPGFKEQFRMACFDTNTCYPGWDPCWTAIKRVWASKWNHRAVISMAKMGLMHDGLQMSVLVQPVIPAEYAFVAHTVNPVNNNKNQVYFELVRGFGETLVGNYPGSAMRVVVNKDDINKDLNLRDYLIQYKQFYQSTSTQCDILSYPSKSRALMFEVNVMECDGVLIFRSDSNGEDLDGYAGAGLFDSVMTRTPSDVPVDYSTDRIIRDDLFQKDVLNAIAAACVEIENMCGSPQDIEGVVTTDGSIYLVQTRPQV